MDRRKLLQALSLGTLAAPALARGAFAQAAATILTVGYEKVAHLAPVVLIADDLKAQNVELKLVEFVRYADARTALLSGSLDIAAVGPADLGISLANGANGVVGIMGVGSSPKYPVVRKGVTMESWEDLKGKKIAIAPGSAVWFQFAASLVEHNIPYTSFTAVNIQGAGSNFNQALKRGEVDAIITWEPFESTAVMEGYADFAKNLDYSASKTVGAELGMLMATKAAATGKTEAVQKFVTAYVTKMKELSGSPAKFGEAIAKLTGLEPAVSNRIAEVIKLGPVVTADQIARQSKAFHDLGVIPKDVSGEIAQYWDGSFLKKAMGA
jgi:sulfonate transport system substrate-binding protein